MAESVNPVPAEGLREQPARGGAFYRAAWKPSDLIYVGCFFLLFAAAWVTSVFVAIDFSRWENRLLLFLAPQVLMLTIPVFAFSRTKVSGSSKKRLPRFLFDGCSGCLTFPFLLLGVAGLTWLFQGLESDAIADRLSIVGDPNPYLQIVVGVMALAIAPISEELFFRGYLLNTLRSCMPAALAVVLQAFFFAILHPYSWTYPVYIFWIGLGLGTLYALRKRLLAPMITHACFNFTLSSLIILAGFLNLHQPAQTWEEAEWGLMPSHFEVGVMDQLSAGASEEDLLHLLELVWGEESLRAWKGKALCLWAWGHSQSTEETARANACLQAAELYYEHGDPRRAILFGLETLESFGHIPTVEMRARNLISKACLELPGDERARLWLAEGEWKEGSSE